MPTKKGSKKYIETPEKLWEHFQNYVKWVKDNPRVQEQVLPKGGVQLVNLGRPLTFIGFENWLFENKIINSLTSYESNQGGTYDAYMPIIARIREIIRCDQIEGGMVGQYNSNLTARLNGLSDKREIDVSVDKKTLDELFPSNDDIMNE